MLDFQSARILRELYLKKTIRAVAQSFSVTPSAISQQISRLENNWGIKLIERSGRNIELTAAGREIAIRADKIHTEIQKANASIVSLRKNRFPTVRISSIPSASNLILMETFRGTKRNSQNEMTIIELEPTESVISLRSLDVDISIIYEPPEIILPSDELIHKEEFYLDKYCVFLHKEHPLAKKEIISIEDVKTEGFIIDTAPNSYMDVFKLKTLRMGFEPKVVARCTGIEMTYALIRAGVGISIQPEIRARANIEGIKAVKISPPIYRKLFLAMRREDLKNPHIMNFRDAVLQAAAKI